MSGQLKRIGHAPRGRARQRRSSLARGTAAGLASLGAWLALGGGAGRSALAADVVWNGGSDVWGNPLAWTPNQVPQTAGDNATVGGGQATLDASYSIGGLTLTGGVIGGTNDLTLGGVFTWSGGSLADAGTVRATAGILLGGAADKVVDARTLINDAAAAWSGGNIITANGASLVNNGTFTAALDASIQSQGTATFFVNSGLFEKTIGAGGTNATTIAAAFRNPGTARVLAGRLVLAGGGSAAGAFELAAPGTELVLSSGYVFAAGSSVSGSGGVTFEFGNSVVSGAYAVGGATTLNGGSVNFTGAATTKDLVLAGGVVTGGGSIAASGAATWTGTVLQGAGSVVSNGTLAISGPDHGLDGRTLTNNGTGTWTGGNILFSANATLRNAGTLSSNFAGSMNTGGATPGRFVNEGVYDRSGPADTVINPVLFNSGTVRLSEGTLTLAGGGSGSGHFDVLANTRLRVVNDYLFAAGSRISGSGTVEFSGGINTVAGTYDVTGGTDIFGGITTFNGNVANLGATLTMFSGFAKFDAPLVQANKLDQFGGGLDGSGNVVFNGLVTWDTGPQKGSGTTTATAGLLITGPNGKGLEGRTVVNAVGSTGTWSAGSILGYDNGTLRNDGTMFNTFDGSFIVASGTPQVMNTGLWVKSGGTGVTTFGGALNNSGTVRVSSGSIFLGAGSATGNFDLLAGGMQVGGVYTLGAGASVTGTNRVLVTGTLNASGAASARFVDLVPASTMGGAGNLTIEELNWTGGRMTGGGTTTVTSALTLAGIGKEIDGRTLRVDPGAVATWSAGDLAVFAGSTLDNAGTLVNTYDGAIFQTGTVNNSGLLIKSGGTGVTTSLAALVNSGTVRVTSGKVFLNAGTSTGNFDLVGGPIELSGGYALGNGATTSGTNALRVFGQVNVTGAASARFVEQAPGGEMTGVGSLSIEHFTWTGGRLTGTGTTTVTVDAALSGGGKEMEGRTLRVNPGATATWSSGDIGAFPGAVIDNAGTFNATFDGNVLYASTQSAKFVNSGVFDKTAGTGRATFTVSFNNSGTVRVSSGIILLAGGGSSTGNFNLLGGPLELTGGYTLAQGTTITGTNVTKIVGDANVTGAVTAKNVQQTDGVLGGLGILTAETFDWQGGTQDGNGVTFVTSALGLSGSGLKTIAGRTVRVGTAAVADWNDGGVRAGGGGLIDNRGTMRAHADNAMFPGDGVTARFLNSGLFEKVGGTGTTSISLPFNNSGVLRVSTGTVSLGGGGSSRGQFDLVGGALELGGGYILETGATITGTNVARLTGDVAVVGTVSAKNVEQTAGSFFGPGMLTVENFAWKGGSQSGPGTTVVTLTLGISGPSVTLDTRKVSIAAGATATWSSGTLFTANGGRIDNSGLFLDTFDGTVVFQTGPFPAFDNKGEFRKTAGAGVTSFGIAFNNTGTARVDSGTLRLTAGGSASGTFDIAAGALLDVASNYTLAAGAAFTGAGKTRLSDGVLLVNAPVSMARLEQVGGTVFGPGELTVGTFDWKGGTIDGPAGAALTVTGGLTINGTDLNLNARKLAVAAGGTATWSAGDVRFSGGATIDNAGTFDMTADVNAVRVDGSPGLVFNNTGTLRKTGGTNFAAFAGVFLNNPGTLEVSSGTLNAAVTQFDSATGTLTGGTWLVSNGAKLDLGGGPGISINRANVTLDGAAASFTKINDLADNRGSFTIKNGRQFFTGVTFLNSGTVSVDATSGMNFANAFDNSGNYGGAGTTSANFVYNSGAFNQSGPLSVGIQFINNAPGVADVSGPQTWGDGAHLIVNGGTVKLRTDAGSAAARRLVLDTTGGTTELRASQHLKGLNVKGGVVKLATGGVVVRTSGYQPTGTPGNWDGQLDVADGRLIVDYDPAGGSPLSLIGDQVRSGYGASGPTHWAGKGIVSSNAAANASFAVGYAEASEVPGAAATFGPGGEAVAGSAVLVRYTLAGDATLDGAVDFNDLVKLAQNYNTTVSATTQSWWVNGDFTYDGLVDFNDLVKLAQNYNTSIPAAGAVPGASAAFEGDLARAMADVPEPGAVGVIVMASAAGAMRRRRRQPARV